MYALIIIAVIVILAHLPRCYYCRRPLIWGRIVRVQVFEKSITKDLTFWDRNPLTGLQIRWCHRRCFYKP